MADDKLPKCNAHDLITGRFVADATPINRFWRYVSPEPNSGCWLWTGSEADGAGYGGFWDGKKHCRAHRFSYEAFVGPIPKGLQLDHKCRVRCCVNPDHLEPVTNKTNSLRGIGFAAVNAKKTHCYRGHVLEGYNLIFSHGNRRECRICRRDRDNVRHRRSRAIARELSHG